jgi:hypothetical protein
MTSVCLSVYVCASVGGQVLVFFFGIYHRLVPDKYEFYSSNNRRALNPKTVIFTKMALTVFIVS